jgi:RHS repeat-associated protein
VHHDAIGSVRALTDEAGAVTDETSYTAFGERIVDSGSDPLAYGFAGEAWDDATGLAYHRARWMDPEVGRFVGADPERGRVRRPGTLHSYVYGGDDPVRFVDPAGREYDLVSLCVAASIVGVVGAIVPSDTRHPNQPISILVLPAPGGASGTKFGDPPGELALFFTALIKAPFNHTLKVSSASEAVQEILNMTRHRQILDLTIAGHSGKPDFFVVGNTGFSERDDLGIFGKLKGKFDPGGYIYITQCRVAWEFEKTPKWQSNNVLTKLSAVVGVPVYGWTTSGPPALAWGKPGGLELAADPDTGEKCRLVRCTTEGCSAQ